ncbi:MAG: rhomboid family intramembrane serine protease, partial [Fibrobacter sp.]|nr:rhomboid family intramembrane serine protease [Fibrobacter sp.]
MYNMPPVTKNIIIINVIFYLASMVAPRFGINLNEWLGLHFFLASDFSVYQLFTYMFMHGGLMHLFFNMFAVWMFGRIMEQAWGAKRFLIYYLACGIGAGVIQEFAQLADYYMSGLNNYQLVDLGGSTIAMNAYLNMLTTVGASGAVYGILISFGLTYPEERMFVFPIPIPIKAKYFVIGYAVIELLLGLQSGSDGIAHFAHLGGMLVGFLLILYWSRGGSFSTSGYIGKLKKFFFERKKNKMKMNYGGRSSDYQYNQQKRENQTEIDRILDKVRKSG